MSADNWAICPRCLKEAQDEAAKQRAAVMATYGYVQVADFDAARAALKDVNREDFRTFREDYDIYDAETGEVKVSYSGQCSKCGLGTDLQTSKRFWP